MARAVADWNDFHTYVPKQTIPILRNFADILQAQTGQYIPWKTGERKQAGVDKVVAAFTQMKTSNQLALYIATRQACEARGQPVSMYRYQAAPTQPMPTFGGVPPPVYPRPAPAGPSWQRADVPAAAYARPGPTLVDWKPSPMWKPILAISNMEMLPDFSPNETSHTRKERKITFSLSPDVCEKMLQTNDHFRPSNERITPTNAGITNRSIPIEYPSVPDVRVDDLSIPFKERGLRGKAGSAPPFDLNKSSRGLTLIPARLGSVTFGHTGATSGKKKDIIKKFYFQVVLVEWTSKEALQKKLADMPPTPIDQCLHMTRKSRSEDDDIEVGSSRMSLKDPLSYMRITRPVRSARCSHQQCFDATWWTESNAMHPQWLCPFCNKELQFSDLIVDGFFLSILQAVPEAIEEVVLEPDGEWHTEDDKFGSPAWLAAHPLDTKPAVVARPLSSSPVPRPPSGADIKGKRKAIEILSSDEEDTPQSRPSNAPSLRTSGPSRQPSINRSSSARPISEGVIDLTLSDSDDDELRPALVRNTSTGQKGAWEREGNGSGGAATAAAAAAALSGARDGPSMGAYRDEDDMYDDEWDDGVGTGPRYLTAVRGEPPIRRTTRYLLSPSPDEDDPLDRPDTPPIPSGSGPPSGPSVPSGPAGGPALPSGPSRLGVAPIPAPAGLRAFAPFASDTYRPGPPHLPLDRPLPPHMALGTGLKPPTIPLPPRPPPTSPRAEDGPRPAPLALLQRISRVDEPSARPY